MSRANHKGRLQEFCQKNLTTFPIYTSSHTGSSHEPEWSCNVHVENYVNLLTNGYASKREAEHNAARLAYEHLLKNLKNRCNTNNLNNIENKDERNTTFAEVKERNIPPATNATTNKSISTTQTTTHIIPADTSTNTTQLALTSTDTTLTRADSPLSSTEVKDLLSIFFDEKNNTSTSTNTTQSTDTNHLAEIPADIDWSAVPDDKSVVILIDLENMQPAISSVSKHIKKIYFFMSMFSTVDSSKYEQYGEIIKIHSAINDAADHLMSYFAGKLSVNLNKAHQLIVGSRDRSSAILVSMLRSDGYFVDHHTNIRTLEKIIKDHRGANHYDVIRV